MDGQEEEYTMVSAHFSGMHRHTRPAAYADKRMKRRPVKSSRPGAYGFSFTGEFPEAGSWQPVEATERRRRYAVPSGQTGSYRAVGSEGAMRIPVINRYGIRLGPAMIILFMVAVLLAGVIVWQVSENSRMSKMLSAQLERMDSLAVETNTTLNEITIQSSGVNIRQEATRIGLMNSRGVVTEYLEVPEDALFAPGTASSSADLASVWGR